ncbi:MAG: MFS transporter [Erysipelotrichaceae bacterium]|nr:MFS transporter [Erysipelotrichaceae bacterium]MBE6116870.1 MFS transporter [Erysipelotrichaceae bacterium]
MERNVTWKEPEKLWNSMFISVFISAIFFNLSAQMSNSLLSLYAKSTGAPADQIGVLMSMFALTALIFRFIAGPAMNAYNRKTLLQFAMIMFGTAYLGFSLSPKIAETTGMNVIHVMMFFRLLQGIGNAFGNACLLTIVSECIPKAAFSSGVGIFALSQSVAQAIGPTVGVWLRDAFGYNTTYVITSALMLFSMILVGLIVHVPNRGTGIFVLNLNNMIAKEALVPALIVFLVSFGFTSINAFFLVYAEERGISGASYYFTVNALALMATKPMVGKLNDKYGFVKVAIPATFLTGLSLVLIGLSTKTWHLLVIALINSCGYGAVQPALQSMCMKSVPAERRGSASSTNYIALDSATLLGPAVCGVVAKAFGYVPMMWIVMAVPIAVAILCIILFRNRLNKIEDDFAKGLVK